MPRSSPPIACSSSTILPGVPLTIDDVVDGDVASRRRTRRRASAATGRRTRRRRRARARASSSAPGIAARNPTRPKLAPITGTPVSRNRGERAQHRAVAAERDRDLRVGVGLDERDALALAQRPQPRDGLLDVRRHPVGDVRSPAQPAASAIQRSSSGGGAGRSEWTRWRTNSWFPFGPGRPESTTPATCARQASDASADLAQHPGAHGRVADDPLRRVGPARLELRLDEDERLKAGRRQPRAPAGAPSAPR